MMFAKSARFYDHLYAFKNYEGAANEIRRFVRERHPSATSLLDVGCGTGKHLEWLRAEFDVEGLDLNPDLLELARERLPQVRLHCADMTDFEIERRFDVITCLFSSIGYVKTAARMRSAVERMAAHLTPGGLLLIEPWFSIDNFWTETITGNFVDEPDLKIAWMYVSKRREKVSVLDIHYMVGEPSGIHTFNEVHEMGLFSPEEYRGAMLNVGLSHEFDDHGFFGRGLHIGTAPPATRS